LLLPIETGEFWQPSKKLFGKSGTHAVKKAFVTFCRLKDEHDLSIECDRLKICLANTLYVTMLSGSVYCVTCEGAASAAAV